MKKFYCIELLRFFTSLAVVIRHYHFFFSAPKSIGQSRIDPLPPPVINNCPTPQANSLSTKDQLTLTQ